LVVVLAVSVELRVSVDVSDADCVVELVSDCDGVDVPLGVMLWEADAVVVGLCVSVWLGD